jgi:nitrogen fixation protein NifX
MNEKKCKYKIAVASSDGIVVNQHFGRADQFFIFGLNMENETDLVEKRRVIPICDGGNHEDDNLNHAVNSFKDCKYVLVSRIGQGAAFALERAGVIPMELPGLIEESLQKLLVYEELQNLL